MGNGGFRYLLYICTCGRSSFNHHKLDTHTLDPLQLGYKEFMPFTTTLFIPFDLFDNELVLVRLHNVAHLAKEGQGGALHAFGDADELGDRVRFFFHYEEEIKAAKESTERVEHFEVSRVC